MGATVSNVLEKIVPSFFSPLFFGGGGGWSHSVCNTVYYKTMCFFTTKTQFFERELFHNGYKQ